MNSFIETWKCKKYFDKKFNFGSGIEPWTFWLYTMILIQRLIFHGNTTKNVVDYNLAALCIYGENKSAKIPDSTTQGYIQTILQWIQNHSCLTFVQDSSAAPHIEYNSESSGCFSNSLGKPNNTDPRYVNLGAGCNYVCFCMKIFYEWCFNFSFP